MELRTAIPTANGNCKATPQILRSLLSPQTARESFVCCSPLKRKGVLRLVAIRAKSGDWQHEPGGWSIVDANIILLKKRILELKAQEDTYELPEDWMEWERKIYPSYHTNIIHAIGWLQYNLIHARPSVGFALLSLITVWVPVSFLVAVVATLHKLTSNS